VNRKIVQRMQEAEKIIDVYSRKDERGIFIISTSIFRLFLDVLRMDARIVESDALKVWNEYLQEIRHQTEIKE
jgi:hypothetical protein